MKENSYIIDKDYCMNSFLQFRFVHDKKYLYKKDLYQNYHDMPKKNYVIKNMEDMDKAITDYIQKNVDDKTVLMLSSGIDSAILASYLPKGTMTFALKCVASEPTTDETPFAKKIAEANGLKNEIIEGTWEDHEKYSDEILEHKRAPFHSIEIQIYKAALRAKELGYNKLLFGEAADLIFGGLDKLLSKDWSFDEFVERFNKLPTKKVLKNYKPVMSPYELCRTTSGIDVYKFFLESIYPASINSYYSSCLAAGVEFISPYMEMELGIPLDLERIRSGDTKYIVRELYSKIYPQMELNKKIPMPRPMGIWLQEWKGPERKEFLPNCIDYLDGDQLWLIYILEKFLNKYEVGE